MRIAVLADTHDKLPLRVLDEIRGADEVWHLGDVTTRSILEALHKLGPPVRVVRGNCDSDPDWPLELRFALEGFSILLVHIPPRCAPPGVDLLFHGHTHVPRHEIIGATHYYNPGCITRPNRGAPASYAWLELQSPQSPVWNIVTV